MTTPYALALDKIDGGSLAEDGEAALLVTTSTSGAEVIVSVPKGALSDLLVTVAALRTQSRLKQGLPIHETEEMFIAASFALGRDSVADSPALSLTLLNGARLIFRLTNKMLTALRETAQAMEGGAGPLDRPDAPSN